MSILKIFRKKPEPIVINDELGSFILKNPEKDKLYKGKINWLGESAYVNLHCDSADSLVANSALEYLRKIVAKADDWDKKIREYVADDMSDEAGMVEIWGDSMNSDDDVSLITREEFLSRISIGFIDIEPNGDIFFDYDLDGMFTDHGMGIDANISGEMLSCSLWG